MVAPLLIGAAVAGGLSGGLGFYRKQKAKKLEKKQAALERARMHAAIQSIEEEEGFRREEDPREQALLKQSLFGRGMGKSSIAEQDTRRLGGFQARRLAALAREKDLTRRGLSLNKAQQKFAKRMAPIEYAQQAMGIGGGVMGMLGGGGG